MQWSGDIGVVSTRYHAIGENETERTILEVWGRSRTGESVCALISGMRPWMEIAPQGRWDDADSLPDDIESSIERLQAMDEIVEVGNPVVKWTDLGRKPHWRLYLRQPFLVPRLRERLSANWVLTSADIPFTNRLFLDADIGLHISLSGKKVSGSEVHLAGGVGEYPVDVIVECSFSDISECKPFDVPWRVFSFDLETSIAFDTILCAAAICEDMKDGSRTVHSWDGDEVEIMRGMTEVVREFDPDIITGYNIDNFDLPRLFDRMEHHLPKSRWMSRAELFGWGRAPFNEDETKRSRSGVIPKRGTTRWWNMAGRCVVDAWWQVRMEIRPERENLAFVARQLFPDDEDKHKMDIDSSKMDEEWANRPDEVMEYCIRDAELPIDLLQAISAITRREAMGAVAKVPLETACNGSTSQLIDSLVIRFADRKDIAVPLTGSADRKIGQITGGYVHDVEAGLHPWVAVLDFKSMYPSIMIANNVCYTTRVDPAHPEQPDEDSTHVSPSGVHFWNQEERKGMVPFLLEGLMERRDFHKEGIRNAKSDSERDFHDRMQYAVKILMNSFYGVFASGFYRFTHKDLGSSITAWARHNIKAIINKLGEENHEVVYSDTDSIFVSSPVGDESDPIVAMVAFAEELANRFSKDGAELEFEKGLSAFFSHGAKKRYVGQVVWPKEEMLIRGYETQRTDSFKLLREGMVEILRAVLQDDSTRVIDHAKQLINKVRNHQVSAVDLVISKGCKGKVNKDGSVDFSRDYSNPNGMPQVRAAKQLIARGLPFTPGMKVGFLVTDASNRPMQVIPWLEEDDGATHRYDGLFYAERLASAFGRVTEAFGWSGKELLAGNRQSSLFSF